jgi:hypothetical protein
MKYADYIKPETKLFAHDLASKRSADTKLILKGNEKTGYFGRFGYLMRTKGLPVHDCPQRTETCEKACYAIMDPLFNLAKNAGVGHIYSELAHSDPMALYDRLRTEIVGLLDSKRIQRSGLIIRIHEAGDFVSAIHVRIYHWLADEFPTVQFYGYSRGWTERQIGQALREINACPNVMIRESLDNDRHANSGDTIGAFFGDDSKAPSRFFKCIEQLVGTKCVDCGLCWTQRKTAVRFVEH